jgi:exonuclease SbcD
MKLVWRSDVHLADTSPESRTDDWGETVLGKLVQVGEIARKEGATAVLDGGDFFHIKTPSRNSHQLIRRVAEIHTAYPCPVLGNIGNHDVKYGDRNNLPEAPLGVLFETGVFKRCYDEHEHVLRESFTVPFNDAKETITVRVVGIPYHGTKYEMNRFTSLVKGDEDYLVVMVHCLAAQAGGTMFEREDIIKYADLANLDPDVWCFGHWHKNQGITKIATGKWVVNVGSLTRGALTEDEMARIPVVVSMDFQAGGVTFKEIPLEVAPAADVFDITERTRQEARKMTVEGFVSSLQSAFKPDGQEDLTEAVSKMGLLDAVRERALSYLEQSR